MPGMDNDDQGGVMGNVQELMTGAVVLLVGYVIMQFVNSPTSHLFGTAVHTSTNLVASMMSNPLLAMLVAPIAYVLFEALRHNLTLYRAKAEVSLQTKLEAIRNPSQPPRPTAYRIRTKTAARFDTLVRKVRDAYQSNDFENVDSADLAAFADRDLSKQNPQQMSTEDKKSSLGKFLLQAWNMGDQGMYKELTGIIETIMDRNATQMANDVVSGETPLEDLPDDQKLLMRKRMAKAPPNSELTRLTAQLVRQHANWDKPSTTAVKAVPAVASDGATLATVQADASRDVTGARPAVDARNGGTLSSKGLI